LPLYVERLEKKGTLFLQMFNHIVGVLESKTLTEAVLDAGGVGYLLRIPQSTSAALPQPGQRVKLLAYLNVSQDSQTLYGFATAAERAFFLQLLTVSGVGPKLALAVLSGGRTEDIQQAIRLGDYASLKRIKGIGEGTAKKIVLELGKILIHQAETPQKAGSAKEGIKPVIAPGLDQQTDLAVKAVVQLQQVPPDVALQAVQRAFAELSAAGPERPVVQDVIQRAMKYV
jgi:Holliday junction DNA helicase RuvA